MNQYLDTQLLKKVEELSQKIDDLSSCKEVRREWVPKYEVMKYLGFGDTQMASIARKYGLVSTTIGKRRFYSTKSLLLVMDKNRA